MITDDGVILGFFSDPSGDHGFVRSRSGAFTEISGPGGLSGQVDPFSFGPPLTINPSGVIAGTYFEPIAGNPFGGNFRVFLLSNGEYNIRCGEPSALLYLVGSVWHQPCGYGYRVV